jgi:predicted phosphodiesterase
MPTPEERLDTLYEEITALKAEIACQAANQTIMVQRDNVIALEVEKRAFCAICPPQPAPAEPLVNNSFGGGCFQEAVFGYTADAGAVNSAQVLTADFLMGLNPDAVFFAGDNIYTTVNTANMNAAWLAFQPLIDAEKAFYCLGNHDLDGDSLGQVTLAKFQHYIGGYRYYAKRFEEQRVVFAAYNTGLNSAGTLVESDGNAVGSVQHRWLRGVCRDNADAFVILGQHHPPRTTFNVSHRGPDLQPETMGIKLVLCGHSHTNEHLLVRGVHYLNVSTATQTIRPTGGTVYDEVDNDTQELWSDDSVRMAVKILVREFDVVVQVFGIADFLVKHEFVIKR